MVDIEVDAPPAGMDEVWWLPVELVVDKAGCRYVSLKIAAKIIDIVILVGMNLKETLNFTA